MDIHIPSDHAQENNLPLLTDQLRQQNSLEYSQRSRL